MSLKSKPSGVLERVAEQVDRGQKPDIYKAAIKRLEEIVTAQAARIETLEDRVANLETYADPRNRRSRAHDGVNR